MEFRTNVVRLSGVRLANKNQQKIAVLLMKLPSLLMAEKIRKGVELQPFTWQQKTLYLTVSIGVGSGRASYRTLTDDFNKLMVEADTCLYRSKKDGRNRTSTMRYGEEVV